MFPLKNSFDIIPFTDTFECMTFSKTHKLHNHLVYLSVVYMFYKFEVIYETNIEVL